MPEFAIVAPILFLMIFGIFDFGHGIYDYITIQTGANEAARVAVQGEPSLGAPAPYAPLSAALAAAAASKNTAGLTLQTAPAQDCPNGPIPSLAILSGGSNMAIPSNTGYVWVSDSEPEPWTGTGSAGGCNTTLPSNNAPLQVTIVYHFAPVTPLIGNVIGSHILLPIYSVYRTEY